jgi:hypothetical protein
LATVAENLIKIAFGWLAKSLEEIWKSDNSAHNEQIKKRNPSTGPRIITRAPAGAPTGKI